jgi:hypothetical protein
MDEYTRNLANRSAPVFTTVETEIMKHEMAVTPRFGFRAAAVAKRRKIF